MKIYRPTLRPANIVLASILLSACASETDGSTDVTLSVTSATHIPMVDSSKPSSGTSFVELELELVNEAISTPIPADFSEFSLQTDQQLVFPAAVESAYLGHACVSGTKVAVGGTMTCRVVFEVPTGQVPTLLSYDDHLGHGAASSVAMVREPDSCVAARYQDNSYPPCKQCIELSCGSQLAAFPSTCQASNGGTCGPCQSLKSPEDYCSCIAACTPSTCWTATLALSTCELMKCKSECD